MSAISFSMHEDDESPVQFSCSQLHGAWLGDDSHMLIIQRKKRVSEHYVATQGEVTIHLGRASLIALRDTLDQYLAPPKEERHPHGGDDDE